MVHIDAEKYAQKAEVIDAKSDFYVDDAFETVEVLPASASMAVRFRPCAACYQTCTNKENEAHPSLPLNGNVAAAMATASAAKTAGAARQRMEKLGAFFEDRRAALQNQRLAAQRAREHTIRAQERDEAACAKAGPRMTLVEQLPYNRAFVKQVHWSI